MRATRATLSGIVVLLLVMPGIGPVRAERTRRVGASLPGYNLQASAIPSNWRDALNYLRAQADVPGVKAGDLLSTNARKHARYMVKNQKLQHHEDPGDPYFSWAGHEAGINSNVLMNFRPLSGGETVSILWGGPFHGLEMLKPTLRKSGYGAYSENNGPNKLDFGAALDVGHGVGSVPDSVDYPVTWPGEGVTTSLWFLTRGENPDPVRGCGFDYPTGTPILIMLKRSSPIEGHSLKADGDPVQHCIYDKRTFKHPNDSARRLGRANLEEHKAIVVIPKNPLKSEAVYDVVVRTAAKRIEWSFNTADFLAPETVITNPVNTGSPPDPYPPSEVETFTGTSSLDSTEVEISLKQVRESSCRWWNGSSFVQGGCGSRLWHSATGTTDWSYALPGPLPAPDFDNDIFGYILYSRGRDAAGNVEFADESGPNRVQFTLDIGS